MRDRMACAMRLSESEADYVGACRALGLTVRESESRRHRGEYVYGHPASGREVTGSALGSSWSRAGVRRRMEDDLLRGVAKPRGESRERLLEAIAGLRTADGSMALQVLGTTHGREVTAELVSSMLDACAKWDVLSDSDFAEAISEAGSPREARALSDARDLAAELGWLPEERDVWVDGWRVPRSGPMAGMVDYGDGHGWPAPERHLGTHALAPSMGAREAARYEQLYWRDDMEVGA